MTARDVIARVVQDFVDPQKGDWVSDAYRSAADDIVAALTAAGYRLIGPGEIDPETIERCVAVVNDHDGMPCHAAPGWSLDQAAHYQYGQQDATSSVAAALRALQSQEAGNEG